MIGKTLGRYEIESKLGEGGMGEVYLARDTRLGRRVALKRLVGHVAADPDHRARFEREARAAAALNHPGIVTLHSIEEADGVEFMTMEWIDGAPLADHIPSGGMPVERALDVAVALSDAVAVAHEAGIVHRDLKPANVMIDRPGAVKVLDFGLARSAPGPAGVEAETTDAEPLTRHGHVIGTIPYMSPEQAEGRPVDARSDVFSLGTILYEMVAGRRPFEGASPLAVMSAVLRDPPPALEGVRTGVPAALVGIIDRCLAKDPADRFASARSLHEALRAIRDGRSAASASPPGDVGPDGTGMSGGTRAVVGVVALVVVVIAAVVLLRGGALTTDAPAPGTGVGAAGRPAVAILTFEDHTGDEEVRWLASGVPSMLITGLAQTPGLDVLSSQRIAAVVQGIGEENVRALDDAIREEIARRSGAGAVVVGSIYKSGGRIRVDVQVEDIETGSLILARDASGTDVFDIVDQLVGEIQGGFAVEVTEDVRGVAEVTSPDLAAYEAYDEGLRALTLYRLPAAREAFDRALAIDPGFAMAHYQQHQLDHALGDHGSATAHLRRAAEHLDRLPARERLLVEAQVRRQLRGDPAGAVEILEGLIQRYPDEEGAYHTLYVTWALDLADPERGLEVLERGVAANPRSGALRNAYGYALVDRGEVDAGIEQLEVYRSIEPDEPNPLDSLAETYIRAGRVEDALDTYADVIAIDSTFASAYQGRAYAYGMLGRYDDAFRELDRAERILVDADLGGPSRAQVRAGFLVRTGRIGEALALLAPHSDLDAPGFSTTALLGQAAIHLRRGELDACREDARNLELAARNQSVPEGVRTFLEGVSSYLYGVTELREGNHQEVPPLARRIEAIDTERMFLSLEGWLPVEIALARSDLEAAAIFSAELDFRASFRNGSLAGLIAVHALPVVDVRPRMLAAQGDVDGAIAAYEDLLTPGAIDGWSVLVDPRFVLAIARLEAGRGNTDAARDAYARFLELWKDADPGLPERVEAERALGRSG